MNNKNGTDRLLIYIMEKSDLEEIRIFHNEDSTLLNLTDINHITELQQEKWFSSLSLSNTSKRYTVRLRKNKRLVSIFRLDRIDNLNKSVYVGADIVKEMRRKGYGKEIYNYFFEYLFNNQGFNRLGLETLCNNLPALSLYEKLGFKKEGQQKEAIFRNGKYHDLIIMGILFKNWSRNKIDKS